MEILCHETSQLLSWFKLAFFGRGQYNDLHYWRTGVICQVWQTFPFWRSTGDAGPCRERWGGLCWAHKAAFWTKQESFHSKSAQTQAVQLNPLASVLIWYTTLHKNTVLTKHRQNICCTHWCWSYRANSACTCMAGALTNYKLTLQSHFLVPGACETGILNEQ